MYMHNSPVISVTAHVENPPKVIYLEITQGKQKKENKAFWRVSSTIKLNEGACTYILRDKKARNGEKRKKQ